MKDNSKIRIDWDYNGKTELSTGTGSLPIEKVIGILSGLVIPTILLYLYFKGMVHWNLWQLGLALILAADLSGGAVANALNSCKRFYHSPYKEIEPKYVRIFKNHWLFTVFHIHPIVIYLCFDFTYWMNGVLWYAIFLLCASLVIKVPLYIKRPVSILTVLISLLLSYYFISPVKGFEWLMPVMFIKIIYGHLVREEPYRPLI